MTIFGIGPKIAATGVVFFFISFLTGRISAVFAYPRPFAAVSWPVGILLIIVGLSFWGDSVRRIRNGYGSGKLVTQGVFSVVRHPMYAAFIVFMVPGASLLLDNWSILFASLAMLAVFEWQIHHEEQYLEQMFGDDYRAYSKKVKRIIPWLL